MRRRPSRSCATAARPRGVHGPAHLARGVLARRPRFPRWRARCRGPRGRAGARCDGLDDARASVDPRRQHGGLGYYVAAARECFEEAGMLLAPSRRRTRCTERTATAATATSTRVTAASARRCASAESLTLAVDLLMPFGHWITPIGPPRRFDTRFFVAAAPAATGRRSRRARDDRGPVGAPGRRARPRPNVARSTSSSRRGTPSSVERRTAGRRRRSHARDRGRAVSDVEEPSRRSRWCPAWRRRSARWCGGCSRRTPA